jgi:hypothetical protein
MLRRNCKRNISYAELSGDEKSMFWEADYLSDSSNTPLPAPEAPEAPEAPAAPEAPEAPAAPEAPEAPAAPEAPEAPASSSCSSDLFVSHYYVDTLLGVQEEVGDTTGHFLVKWKG